MITLANGKQIGNYKKLSNRKKRLLTKEFCEDFKNNMIKYAVENDKNRDIKIDIDYSKECYMGFYGSMGGTFLFYDALKDTCIKHNVVKAIYEYAKRMPWYDSDCFDNDLLLRMVELEVIPYTTEDYENMDDGHFEELEGWVHCDIITHHKGYDVIQHDYWDGKDKKSLESIYIDSPNVEIIWY